MSWNELKDDIGGVYSFIKWVILACVVGAVLWSLKSCTWKEFWDSGLY